MPTQERLRELFYYEDGNLYPYKSDQFRRADKSAGGLNGRYVYACVDYHYVALHRLIWVWHNGLIPEGLLVDHIDRDALNNKIENLRLATLTDNSRNRTVSRKSISGVVGVTQHRRYKDKWRATIAIGTFSTIEEAIAARKHAEQLLGFPAS